LQGHPLRRLYYSTLNALLLDLLPQERRALVNWQQPDTQLTCLHVAASKNMARIAAMLLDNSMIKPNLKEVRCCVFRRCFHCRSTCRPAVTQKKGRTAFYVAASLGRLEAALVLVNTPEVDVYEAAVRTTRVLECRWCHCSRNVLCRAHSSLMGQRPSLPLCKLHIGNWQRCFLPTSGSIRTTLNRPISRRSWNAAKTGGWKHLSCYCPCPKSTSTSSWSVLLVV
jgi:hypothetical protein